MCSVHCILVKNIEMAFKLENIRRKYLKLKILIFFIFVFPLPVILIKPVILNWILFVVEMHRFLFSNFNLRGTHAYEKTGLIRETLYKLLYSREEKNL